MNLSKYALIAALLLGSSAAMAEGGAERTREGLAHARAQGRTGGRRPSLTPQQVEAITATLAAGMSIRDVATMHGVSERTISRVRAGIYGQSKRPQT